MKSALSDEDLKKIEAIEVVHSCTIHLSLNSEILECEFRSDNTGQDLLNYVLHTKDIRERDIWGLKFENCAGQRYWLDLQNLIRPQVKRVCPLRFHFKVKVYPPEPYKILDETVRTIIFNQLRMDLLSGRLQCDAEDAGTLMALLLQYFVGDFDSKIHYGNYLRSKFCYKTHASAAHYTEVKAMELHKNELIGVTKLEAVDLFLRLSANLESYGVDPFFVEDGLLRHLTLWVNYTGLSMFLDNEKTFVPWEDVEKVTKENNKLFIHIKRHGYLILKCFTQAECGYIFSTMYDHHEYFEKKKEVGYEDIEERLKNLGFEQRSEKTGNDIIENFGGVSRHEYSSEVETLMSDIDETGSTIFFIKTLFHDGKSAKFGWSMPPAFIAAILVFILFGTSPKIFGELPSICFLKTFLNNFVNKFSLQ